MEKNIEKKKREKKNWKIRPLTILFIILDLGAIMCFYLAYGPYDELRNLLVTTAMRTMDHQYLAYVLYSEETVSSIVNNNYFIALEENVNLEDIVIDTSEKEHYDNKYDEQILTRESGNDLYKVIKLKVGSSSAHLVAIYDPTKIHLISQESLGGATGERIITMCERYGGVVCVNGGGFVDNGYGSGIPLGYVIRDGEIIWSDGDSSNVRDNIIGITDEGKLTLMSNATGEEALEAGVSEGLVFGPFLIVNGKPLEIVGDPWGRSPRVVIAQRKDGVMLLLVVDGENYIDGASLQDLIDVLTLYGAYNAANLDGGTSATLIINGKLTNNPPSSAKKTNGRYVVTGFGLVP